MTAQRVLLIAVLVLVGLFIGCSDHFGEGRVSRNAALQPPPPPVLLFFPFGGPLPPAQVGMVYSTVITVNGGLPPYTWSIVGGALPPGLTLGASTAATNSITGTPAMVGSFTFQIQVQTSGNPPSGTQTFSIDVN